jgi:hypothetical protein
MWENGFFWLALALFFAFGPLRRRRWSGGRWSRHRIPAEQPALPESTPLKRDLERETRREEQLIQLETRVAELESRLDFAERLLARGRDQAITPD